MKTLTSKKSSLYVLFVWVLIWINFVTQYWFDSPLEALIASTAFVLVAYPLTTYLSTTLLRKAMTRRRWGIFMLQFLGISVAFGAALHMVIQLLASLEIAGYFKDSELFSGMDAPIHGLINISLAAVVINFGFCGLRFFQWNVKLQKELHASQLQTLNGQINPHSMFNVLNHIHVLLQKDPAAADDLLLKYSDVLRYQLYNANKEKVTLRQDTDFMKQYIEVEKVRWKNKITVTEDWGTGSDDVRLPPLLFITFLENAFKYVARSDSEKGSVDIVLSQSGNVITFDVKNSKSAIKPTGMEGTGLGLANLRKRLEILFPNRHELTILDSADCYSARLILTV